MVLSPPAPAGERPVAPMFRYLPPGAAAVALLEPKDCRWPLGRPGIDGFRFCRAPRQGFGSYCAAHARAARAGSATREARS